MKITPERLGEIEEQATPPDDWPERHREGMRVGLPASDVRELCRLARLYALERAERMAARRYDKAVGVNGVRFQRESHFASNEANEAWRALIQARAALDAAEKEGT